MKKKRAIAILLFCFLFFLSSCGSAVPSSSITASSEASSSQPESSSVSAASSNPYPNYLDRYYGTIDLKASSDLSMTAYAVNEAGTSRLVIRRDGTETTAFSTTGGLLIFGVQWSPDDKRVAFYVMESEGYHLYLYNVTSDKLTDTGLVGYGSTNNVWSGDSTKVLFTDSKKGIYYWDTVSQKVVTVVAINRYKEESNVVGFSPDSTKVAFELQLITPYDASGTRVIKTYNVADGTTVEYMRFTCTEACNGSIETPYWPSYSEWISNTAYLGKIPCQYGIYKFDLATNQKTLFVENAFRMVVSPDMKYLVYDDSKNDYKPLLKNIATGTVTDFSGLDVYAAPFWSSDSKQIFMCSDNAIRIYGLDGKQMGDTIATPTFGISPPVMTKDGLWYQGKK